MRLHPPLLLLALVLALSGCKDRPIQEQAAPPPSEPTPIQDADLPPGTLTGDALDPIRIPVPQLAGEVDLANRYLFTVLIEAYRSSATEGAFKCSGVIIAPRLVLTAGHCVCPRQTGASNSHSTCAATAYLTAMTYLPPEQGQVSRASHEMYEGVIRPHPQFEVLLDRDGGVTSIRANLALIILNAPLPERLRPVMLGETQAELHSPLVTVGYGNARDDISIYGRRRFNRTRVASSPAGQEVLLLEPPQQPLFANDSGGPCLREGALGPELVGISNRGFGKDPTCTNLDPYRAWLRDEILTATKAR